jgi:Cell division control protein 24, OB domain 3
VLLGKNRPTSGHARHPLRLSDVPVPTFSQTLNITVWDSSKVHSLRPGMLVYAENLVTTSAKGQNPNNNQSTSPENCFTVNAARGSHLRAISSLPAILTSSLFPTTLLSTLHTLTLAPTPYVQQPSNFIVRATILECTSPVPGSPVHIAHSPCMRLVDTRTNTFECSFCNFSSHFTENGEWDKVFQLHWIIGDGSAECTVSASAKVHEVNVHKEGECERIISHCF